MLSYALFEGDLPRNKNSESNTLAASEELVIKSLSMMREEVRIEESETFQNEDSERPNLSLIELQIFEDIHPRIPLTQQVMNNLCSGRLKREM